MKEIATEINSHSFSRRHLLTRILPGAAIAVSSPAFLSCNGPKNSGETLQPEPTATETTGASTKLSYADVDIYLDKNYLPLRYIRKNVGEDRFRPITSFDRDTVLAIRDKAISSGEPQLLEAIAVNKSLATHISPEHPRVKELPKDTLPEDEVARRGVNIIQAKQTTLHVRQTAFEPGGPLDSFNNTGRKLRIILVDGPVVHTAFMEDPKYDGVKRAVKTWEKLNKAEVPANPEVMRKFLITTSQKRLEVIRLGLSSSTLQSAEKIDLEMDLMKQQQIAAEIQNISGEELIRKYLVQLNAREAAGLYDRYFAPDEEAVFVAAGRSIAKSKWIVGFNSSGEFVNFIFSDPIDYDYTPNPSQTYPNPNDFQLNPTASPDNPRSYPYGGETISLVLEHELMHDKLIEQARRERRRENHSEYDTDMAAMDLVRKGSEKWITSSFTDDSGYFFAWSVPEDYGGGYIITKNLKTSSTHAA